MKKNFCIRVDSEVMTLIRESCLFLEKKDGTRWSAGRFITRATELFSKMNGGQENEENF